MRIIGGARRGLHLAEVGAGDAAAHLRPTSDRVREAIFNLLVNGGYGDPVTTLLRAGTTETRANTCYFRTWFTGSTAHRNLTLRVRRDDGAVIYLNGVEVARTNMPTGAIAFGTRALSSVNDAAETTLYTIPISARLVEGRNLLAVEVHQFQQASSDLTFDLSLTATR
jgi:hypothetical protein